MSTNRKSVDASRGTSGRVVVGVHGSESSLRALRQAVEIALDRDWELDIVTAWPDADDPLIHDVPGRYITARGHAMEHQRQALEALDPVLTSRVETFLLNARPAQALISRCRDADVLVIGSGRPPQDRGRPGVGVECVDTAPCTVMVVPDPSHGAPEQASETPSPARHQRHGQPRAKKGRKAANA